MTPLAALLLFMPATTMALAPTRGDGLAVDELVRVDGAVERGSGVPLDPAQRERIINARARLGCLLDDVDCLVQLAVAVDADRIVSPRASRAGGDDRGAGGIVLELRLVDVATASVVARAAGPVDERELDRSAAALFAALARPEAARALLRVETNAGASVIVDGVAMGNAPLEAFAVDDGPHAIEARDGARIARAQVEVPLGDVTRVTLPLPDAAVDTAGDAAASPTAAEEASAPPAWVVMSGGALAAALGAGMIGAGFLPWLELQTASNDLAALDAGAADADIKAARARFDAGVESWESWGIPLVITGFAVAGAGAGAAVVGVLGVE